MASKEKTQEFKKRLENELLVVREWLAQHQECLSEEELKTFERDQKENAMEERQRFCTQHKAREKDIVSALERIKNHTFGICIEEGCGKEISEERLNGDPARKRDAECQLNHQSKKNNKRKT
jgi:RNA polymerase-binding transcription factor DksA